MRIRDLVMNRRWRPVPAALLALAVSVASWLPAGAVVRFDPTPAPTLSPPASGGDVEVAWAGVGMTFPSGWRVQVKTPVQAAGASLLVAFGPGATTCTLDRYDPTLVDSWQDAGVEPVDQLLIGGLPAEQFDDMLGAGIRKATAYTIRTPEFHYSLMCAADEPPADRWRSIVQSFTLAALERP